MIRNKKLNTLIDFLKNKKTSSLKVLDIRKISIISDYFVIVSMNNIRSVEALDKDITDHMLKNGYDLKRKEGGKSRWILQDYEDIIIHIFDDEYKSFYNLDKLWADAKEVSI